MTGTGLSLYIDGITDLGVRRKNNEDAWWAGQLPGDHRSMQDGGSPLALAVGTPAAPVLLLVSDGVGGANAGEVASQMAVSLISADRTRRAAELASPATAPAAVRTAFTAADEAIKAKATEPGCDGMGATISLFCFLDAATACWGQAGDSRIYVCRRGQLRQISRDHSPVGRLRQEGKITEKQARQHPQRHEIDQSLGDPGKTFRPDTGLEAIQAGDVYLLCSDGLSDGLWDHEIEQLLGRVRHRADVRPVAQKLVDGSKQASGRDNITAVVALVEPAAEGPAARASFWRRLLRR
jgi:PPM family protein phosphatase